LINIVLVIVKKKIQRLQEGQSPNG